MAQNCDRHVGGGDPGTPRLPYPVALRLHRRVWLHNANCGLGHYFASGGDVKWDPTVNFDDNKIQRLASLLDTAAVSFEGAIGGLSPPHQQEARN